MSPKADNRNVEVFFILQFHFRGNKGCSIWKIRGRMSYLNLLDHPLLAGCIAAT